ncbi:MAG: DUF4418 family protein [Bacillota bacterium]
MNVVARSWRPLLFMLLGLTTVFGAHFFLDTCAEAGHFMTTAKGMKVHMGCTWTERAVMGVGGLVAFMGLILLFAREAARGLSLAVAGAGVLMILIPVWLIPTCANPEMPCNLSLKPGSLLLGGVVVLAGLIASIQLRRLDGPEGKTA